MPSIALHSGSKWFKSAKNNFTKHNFFNAISDSHNIHFRSFHSLFIQNLSNCFGNLYDQLISQLFLCSNCWRIFEIYSHCAPQKQLKLLKRKRETLIVSTDCYCLLFLAFFNHFPCQSQFIQSLFGFAF